MPAGQGQAAFLLESEASSGAGANDNDNGLDQAPPLDLDSSNGRSERLQPSDPASRSDNGSVGPSLKRPREQERERSESPSAPITKGDGGAPNAPPLEKSAKKRATEEAGDRPDEAILEPPGKRLQLDKRASSFRR
ncbi:uncharacterized protein BDV17DRAFT_294751 [Aspergillus undulatus]|uniref:uncharacterized protein n=1 Tax=Aspergillus undulatus TaxID=1810928 RepID=UPI003CCDD505